MWCVRGVLGAGCAKLGSDGSAIQHHEQLKQIKARFVAVRKQSRVLGTDIGRLRSDDSACLQRQHVATQCLHVGSC